MNNVRFATSLHIMTILASDKDEFLSSRYIAGSININATIVRKEISNLRQLGLIYSREGKGGGFTLGKPAKKIRLSDIYLAAKQAPLLGKTNHPNPACPVGKEINKHIDALYNEAEDAIIKKLNKITLAYFHNQFK